MQETDCFQVGYIRKVHGLQGATEIFLDVDVPEEYAELESFLVRFPEGMIPFFMTSFRMQGAKSIVQWKGIQTVEQAATMVGKELWLPLSLLPALKDPKQFYYHELPGCQVKDAETGALRGVILDVYDHSSNLLVEVKDAQGEIHLFPAPDALLVGLDRAQKILTLRIPEGL